MNAQKLTVSMVSFLLAASLTQCGPLLRGQDETESSPPPPPPPQLSVETDLIPSPAEKRAVTRPLDTAPMLSGGTLLVSRDGAFAVVSEPEQDVFQVVNLEQRKRVATVQAEPRSEPGRCAEDASGRFHCILRHGSAMLTLTRSGAVLRKRAVCSEPRGIAVSPTKPELYVACELGEFLTLSTGDLSVLDAVRITDDSTGAGEVVTSLRDVVALPNREVWVNQFREAAALRIDPSSGHTLQRSAPAGLTNEGKDLARAKVGWRLLSAPNGELWELHQLASLQGILPNLGWRPGQCTPPCIPTLGPLMTVLSPLGKNSTLAPILPNAVLPIDIAMSTSGQYLVVAAGNIPYPGETKLRNSPLLLGGLTELKRDVAKANTISASEYVNLKPTITPVAVPDGAPFKPVAVAARGAKQFVIQTRDTRALYLFTPGALPFEMIPLASERAQNESVDLFHTATQVGLSCASCHPEGGEDSHTWNLAAQNGSTPRPRRTQNLRGGLLQTAPYHWDGEIGRLEDLVRQDMQLQQGPQTLSTVQLRDLANWLQNQPPLWSRPQVSTQNDRSTGRAVFETANCTSCHNGPAMTSNMSMNLDPSAGSLQVPSLIGLASRAPYLHDGCATSLEKVFDKSCAKDAYHSKVSPADVKPLVTYLRGL